MNILVEKIIEDEKCPIVNSIVMGNGDLYVINFYYLSNNPYLKIICKSSIDSFFYYNDSSQVSSYDIIHRYENELYSVCSGEGSFGGDGLVYVVSKITNEVLWILFLEHCNPFIKSFINEASEVIAYTSSNNKFIIPIDSPEKIKVCRVSIQE